MPPRSRGSPTPTPTPSQANTPRVVNRSRPPGTIIPELPCADVLRAAEWLCRAFGFRERLRIGTHRVQLTFGEGSVVVTERPADPRGSAPEGDARPGAAAGSGHRVLVAVGDVDAHFDRARECGARIIAPPADHSYGERQYVAEDPDGHRWTFSQTIADVDPAAWGGTLVE